MNAMSRSKRFEKDPRAWGIGAVLVWAAMALSTVHSAAGQPERASPNVRGRQESIDPAQLNALGIRTLRGKHLTLQTDVRDRPDVDELTSVFDLAVPQWCELFGIDSAKLADWHQTAAIIADRTRFERAGLFPRDIPQFPAGYQRGDDIWVYVQQGDYYTRHLLLHEGTHAVMQQFLGGLGAPWYAEGMAELVGLNQWGDGRLTIGHAVTSRDEVPYWGRVALIRKAVEDGELKSLVDVLQLPGVSFRQVESYAWAWAACEFLSHHPLSKDVFAKLIDHCEDDPDSFNRRLTEPLADCWAELEFEWRQMLIEIDYGYDVVRAASSNAEPVNGRFGRFSIAADRGWQNTGIAVARGQSVTIRAAGEFQIANDGQPWPCQANGVTIEYYRGRPLGRLVAAVLPSTAAGTSADEFLRELSVIDVGPSATIMPEVDGQLLLRLNESPARWRDNAGSLTVTIE
jgi:hypothetical protein